MTQQLTADGIMLSFGERRILSNIYISCDTGKVTGILGRNGTGKSCLMNIIYGTLPALSKSVRFNQISCPKAYRRPDLITYLPQFHFIPPFLSLHRIFADFSLSYPDFEQLFPDFTSLRHHCIGSLSGGQRRLVEVYVMIKTKTAFSMLDEPFSQLMPLHIDIVKSLIVNEKTTKGFLITDHLYKQVMDVCDQLYVLKDGTAYLTSDATDIEKLGYARF